MAVDALKDLRSRPQTLRCEDECSSRTGEFEYAVASWIDLNEKAHFGMTTTKRSAELTINDLQHLLKEVPDETVYPAVERFMTVVYEEHFDPAEIFIQRPSLHRLDDRWEAAYVPQKLHDEIIALEYLRRTRSYSSERNRTARFVPYYGCIVKRGRVTGIVQQRFSTTLADYLNENEPYPSPSSSPSSSPSFSSADWDAFDVEATIRRLRSSVQRLHEMGLAHNDLCAENIGLTTGQGTPADYTPVILNFGNCKPLGEKIVSGGTSDVEDFGFGESSMVHDERALQELEISLRWVAEERGKRKWAR